VSSLLYRSTREALPMAARGRGSWVIDTEGREYLDARGGAAVSCLGRSHPRVIAAVERQLRALPFIHYGVFRNEAAEALAERLVARAPKGIAKAFFLQGGSEANEAALKLARQYFVERGEPDRQLFVSRRNEDSRDEYRLVQFLPPKMAADGERAERVAVIALPRPATPIASRARSKGRKHSGNARPTSSRRRLLPPARTGSRPSFAVIIAPAYDVTHEEIGEIVARLAAAIEVVASVCLQEAKVPA
jgi:adenosylmethionine-8-amino-7-oxononanoate aminotransferase